MYLELFTLKHLTFSYPEQEAQAIYDVSLTVNKVDFFVLCGHSGCGKSTLLRQLKPSIAPHGNLSGEILFHGEPLLDIDSVNAAAKIGFVMQSPETQVVTDKVWHGLAFGLESLGYDTATIRRHCAEMAAFFGIENWYYKNVAELSGGQKQLLCLASVMTLQPEALILDEPTAQLYPIAASEFLNTLGKINRELGTTIILSEHRLEEALALANQAAVMERGQILCSGPVDKIGTYLKIHENTMFSAMPCAMRVWGSVECDLSCPVTVKDGRTFLHAYLQDHPAQPLPQKTDAFIPGEELITASEVWFRYEKELPDVVKGLSFQAHAGELFCILGGNGSGKITTLKLLSGLKKPYRGEVITRGRIGFLAGVFYRKGLLVRSKESLCIFGALCTFQIYGGIMNPASALVWGSESLNMKIILGYYLAGFPMDAVHAAATMLFLWFGAEPMLEKLDRVKIKYGLAE